MNEKKELIEQISGLFVYYGIEISPVVLKIYITALLDYPIADIKSTVAYFIKNSDKMPKIADFTNYFNGGGASLDDRAEIAWSLVLKAIDKFGTYYSFTFRDKAIRKALDIINYAVICDTLESELNWKKADFIKVYKTFAKLDPLSYDAPDYIASFIELNNNQAAISDFKECSAFYVGKMITIVENGKKIKKEELSDYLKLNSSYLSYLTIGGQNGRKELE
ncbi:MAG: hypothetical protein ACYCTB_05635 [bacterium]